MKRSRYTTNIKVNKKIELAYNTMTRRYIAFKSIDRDRVWDMIDHPDRSDFSVDEMALFSDCVKNGLIIRDDVNELELLHQKERIKRTDNSTYRVLQYITYGCNFRCAYCQQSHENRHMTDDTQDAVVRHIEKIIKTNDLRAFSIDWFGGEPLLKAHDIFAMMHRIKQLCGDGCQLSGSITTNGYLLSDKIIDLLLTHQIRYAQITVDGNRTSHDQRRYLKDHRPTFDHIMRRVCSAVSKGIRVTLRINIDEENAASIDDIIDAVEPTIRNKICVSISNLFQNKDKISTYRLYKQALDAGFRIDGRWNTYIRCHTCQTNAAVFNTDGYELKCSNVPPYEDMIGHIGRDGSMEDYNPAIRERICKTSAINNPVCRRCIELPFCVGSCKLQRLDHNDQCTGRDANGLSMQERAKLDYYYDLCHAKKKGEQYVGV